MLKGKARIELSVLDDLTTMRGEPLKPNPKFFKIVTRFDYMVTARQRADLEHIEKVTGVAIGSLTDLEKALEKAVQKGVSQGLAGISPRYGDPGRAALLHPELIRVAPDPAAARAVAVEELGVDRLAGPAELRTLFDWGAWREAGAALGKKGS